MENFKDVSISKLQSKINHNGTELSTASR